MHFFARNPRRDLKDLLQFLDKKWAFENDVMREEKREAVRGLRDEVKALLADRSVSREEVGRRVSELQARALKWFPAHPHDAWREWTEVILVAAVVAIGFKTYFLQPFKIPTHSMKPTLYGIYTEPVDSQRPLPNPLVRLAQLVLQGKSQHRLVAKESGVVTSIRQEKLWGFLPIDTTVVRINQRPHQVWTGIEAFSQGVSRDLRPGLQVSRGDVLANFTTQAGDHLFVNKMSYHFRLPQQGEVFVFTTNGITGIENRNRSQGIRWGQFYIKRCVGVPGQELQLVEPHLLSNGEIVNNRPAFERVYSMRDGYAGYTHGPRSGYLNSDEATHRLGEDRYWAMGDNSPNSWDSRAWGDVPRRNLVGTGFFVYWPFTKRWGLID